MSDLKELIGNAVSILVFNDPFPIIQPEKAECLIIRRPSDDSWMPNYFSPITGHVEERDLEKLKTFPPPWTDEKLYLETGKREFKEETKREPSFVSLRYVGKYHDTETCYNVAVLSGEVYGAGTTIKKIVIPKVGGTKEAPGIYWKSVKEIQKLIEKNKFAGKKSFEIAIQNMQKFI
jgi:8-oxo-dGTP pyrophosphatase MutT (NUDIX family)